MEWRLCELELGQVDVPRIQGMAMQLFLRTASLEEEGTNQGVFYLQGIPLTAGYFQGISLLLGHI